MRRQKRDKLGRAHSNGYQAGLSGKSKEQCPYEGVVAMVRGMARSAHRSKYGVI